MKYRERKPFDPLRSLRPFTPRWELLPGGGSMSGCLMTGLAAPVLVSMLHTMPEKESAPRTICKSLW